MNFYLFSATEASYPGWITLTFARLNDINKKPCAHSMALTVKRCFNFTNLNLETDAQRKVVNSKLISICAQTASLYPLAVAVAVFIRLTLRLNVNYQGLTVITVLQSESYFYLENKLCAYVLIWSTQLLIIFQRNSQVHHTISHVFVQ